MIYLYYMDLKAITQEIRRLVYRNDKFNCSVLPLRNAKILFEDCNECQDIWGEMPDHFPKVKPWQLWDDWLKDNHSISLKTYCEALRKWKLNQ